MNNSKLTLLLVGSHFVPPAKAVLQALPGGSEVELRPEPSNPYDALAIEVWLSPSTMDLPAALTIEEETQAFSAYGANPSELVAEGQMLKLGHVAASQGKPLQKAKLNVGEALAGTEELHALGEGPWSGRVRFAGEYVLIDLVEPEAEDDHKD